LNDKFYFNIKKKRPEELFRSVKDYYTSENIKNYAKSKSMMRIQEKITVRALELLEIRASRFRILDAGCGPGFVALYLKELGFDIVALDIISEFLKFYNLNDVNPIAADMSYLPFKSNSFDAIIIKLTKSFYKALKYNHKAVFQFYPKNNEIMEKVGKIFRDNTNFKGNFIIDNPNNPKKRKIFLLLNKT